MEPILRRWRPEDAAGLAPLADNWAVAQNLRDVFPHPYTPADAEAFIQSCLAASEREALYRAITVDGRAVGGITITRGQDVYRRSAELGYWLAEPYWGRGIMTAAVAGMTALAFASYGDLLRIHAEPYARNRGSRRVLEKNGYQLEGILRRSVVKAGEILDSCVYARLREEEK